jgi:hypothetical protein
MTRVVLKGTYKLNPTKAVMKSNSATAIKLHGQNVPGFKKVKPPKAIKGNKK